MSEELDFDNIPAETPLSPYEAIIRRHRREKKELQGKIFALKKTATINDKKKKREIAENISKLEVEMETRHKAEIDAVAATINGSGSSAVEKSESIAAEAEDADGDKLKVIEGSKGDEAVANDCSVETPSTPKLSKARKRREKKESQQREIRKRIESETEHLVETSEWKQEDKQLEEILNNFKLEIVDIPSDGHCLYKAVSDQLKQNGETVDIHELRQKTAEYLKKHQQDYLSFFDEDISSSQEKFDTYCDEIESTAAWGGQIEVNILSNVLGRPIKVLQAEGPPINFGEEFGKKELTLTYHRHKLKLGAHYNSTIPKSEEELNDL